MIVALRKFDVLNTNICPRSETSRAIISVNCEYKPRDNDKNKSIDLTLKSASSLGMKVCTNSSGPMLASLSC